MEQKLYGIVELEFSFPDTYQSIYKVRHRKHDWRSSAKVSFVKDEKFIREISAGSNRSAGIFDIFDIK